MGFIIGGQSTTPSTTYFATGLPTVTGSSSVKDSQGNIYFTGQDSSSPSKLVLFKLNSSGVVQWQRQLSQVDWNSYGNALAVDSSNNVYIAGNSEYPTSGTRYPCGVLAKYDTNGNLQFVRQIYQPNYYNECSFAGLKIDSSDNIFVAGKVSVYGNNYWGTRIIIVKYNTSGVIQWKKETGGTNDSKLHPASMTMDSSGNFYLSGYSYPGYPAKGTGVVHKIDNTGTFVWAKEAYEASSWVSCTGIAVDSSGNVYAGGYYLTDVILTKWNSSGTLQWQRKLSSAGSDDARSLALDSSGNVYMLGITNGVTFVAKYNSSGTIQWQRQLSGSGSASHIWTDDTFLYISGTVGGSTGVLITLPTDGSLTGTYTINGVSVTVAAGSLTDSASSVSFSNRSDSSATTSFIEAPTASLANSTPTLTPVATTLATIAGTVIPSGITMGGTGSGMVISSYVAPTGPLRAIFGYGRFSATNVSATNLVANTGVVATDTTGVGTARYWLAAAGYGGDKAIFGYGTTNGSSGQSMTNLVSNTGVVATDTTGVGTVRAAPAAATYGTDKAIFGYGTPNFSVTYSMTNLVSNTGVVATDTTGVGTERALLAAAGYGTDKAIFGYGSNSTSSATRVSTTNKVSNTGVVAANTTGVGTARLSLAAAGYGTDKAIFGYGSATSATSITNLVSNTGVVATDTSGVGTARLYPAATTYDNDKAIFGYGTGGGGVTAITNLVSNTGVVAADTTGVGTARYGPAAAAYG